MQRTCILMAALAVWSAPTLGANKCTQPDGRVVYQDAPCGAAKAAERVNLTGAGTAQPNSPGSQYWRRETERLARESRAKQAEAASAPATASGPVALTAPSSPDPLQTDAERCMAWYRPKLRDPRSAYWRDARREHTVVTITIHATNGYGGYVPKAASCEFKLGQLDDGWTATHAQRGGWH